MTPPPRPPLFLLIAMAAIGPVSIDIFLPSLPDMTRVFDTDIPHVQMTMSIFIGGFAIAQLVLGPLSDRFGRRPVMLGGLAVYVLASLTSLTARSIDALIIARLVQSLGACAGPVLSRAIVRDAFPKDKAAQTMALIAAVFTVAPAVAPIFGGWLHTLFDWRANFVVMLIFGIALFIGIWLFLGETNITPDRNALKLGRMLQTYVLLVVHRAFLGHTLMVSFVFSAMFCFISIGSFVLIDILGVSPEHFGFYFAVVVGGMLIGNLISARFSRRLGSRRMIVAGLAVALPAGIVLAGASAAHVQAVGAVVLPMAVIYLATGLLMPNAIAQAIAPHGRIAGSASALLGFIQMTAAANAGWLASYLLDGTTRPLCLMVVVLLLGGVLSYAVLCRGRS